VCEAGRGPFGRASQGNGLRQSNLGLWPARQLSLLLLLSWPQSLPLQLGCCNNRRAAAQHDGLANAHFTQSQRVQQKTIA
jgi:hypothetical protein